MAKKKTRGKKKSHQRSQAGGATAIKKSAAADSAEAHADEADEAEEADEPQEAAAEGAASSAPEDRGARAGGVGDKAPRSAKVRGRGRRQKGAQERGAHVDANIPSPDGDNVSSTGGLYFVAIIFGLIGLAIVAQFLMG